MEIAAIAVGTFFVIRFIKNLIAENDRIDQILDEEIGPRPTRSIILTPVEK